MTGNYGNVIPPRREIPVVPSPNPRAHVCDIDQYPSLPLACAKKLLNNFLAKRGDAPVQPRFLVQHFTNEVRKADAMSAQLVPEMMAQGNVKRAPFAFFAGWSEPFQPVDICQQFFSQLLFPWLFFFLLLRSGAPDPHQLLGRRTFLHPTTVSAALMDHEVRGYAGAPQTIYSDHYLENVAVDGPIGYKLEVPPMHPVLFSTTLQGFGEAHAQLMREFATSHAMLALLRDGFHPQSPGGTVQLRDDGTPLLDYPITDFVWEGVRRSWLAMAELQFAAGAKRVYVVHEQCTGYASWAEAKAGIGQLPLKNQLARIVSAHVMGGCGMAADGKQGVTDAWGRYRGLGNLSVCDGSLFPTSIGANPQLSVYGLAARNASRLARTNPPPADAPIRTMFCGSFPCASSH